MVYKFLLIITAFAFQVCTGLEPPPTLQRPTNGAVIGPEPSPQVFEHGAITFKWPLIKNALYYHVSSEKLEDRRYVQLSPKNTVRKVERLTVPLPTGQYRWQVYAALAPDKRDGPRSEKFVFHVKKSTVQPSSDPHILLVPRQFFDPVVHSTNIHSTNFITVPSVALTLISPKGKQPGGSPLKSGGVNFTWFAVPNAMRYYVKVEALLTGENYYWLTALEAMTSAVSRLDNMWHPQAPGNHYRWFEMAEYEKGVGPWSAPEKYNY